eukprot:PhM_4_TR13339/c2_g1_i1/m.17529
MSKPSYLYHKATNSVAMMRPPPVQNHRLETDSQHPMNNLRTSNSSSHNNNNTNVNVSSSGGGSRPFSSSRPHVRNAHSSGSPSMRGTLPRLQFPKLSTTATTTSLSNNVFSPLSSNNNNNTNKRRSSMPRSARVQHLLESHPSSSFEDTTTEGDPTSREDSTAIVEGQQQQQQTTSTSESMLKEFEKEDLQYKAWFARKKRPGGGGGNSKSKEPHPPPQPTAQQQQQHARRLSGLTNNNSSTLHHQGSLLDTTNSGLMTSSNVNTSLGTSSSFQAERKNSHGSPAGSPPGHLVIPHPQQHHLRGLYLLKSEDVMLSPSNNQAQQRIAAHDAAMESMPRFVDDVAHSPTMLMTLTRIGGGGPTNEYDDETNVGGGYDDAYEGDGVGRQTSSMDPDMPTPVSMAPCPAPGPAPPPIAATPITTTPTTEESTEGAPAAQLTHDGNNSNNSFLEASIMSDATPRMDQSINHTALAVRAQVGRRRQNFVQDARRVVLSDLEEGPCLAKCSRDWNAEFQELIEAPCMSPHDAAERATRIKQLQQEFHDAALPVIYSIVKERTSVAKTIPLASAGGIAGGDKYFFGNIFFKYCNTIRTERLYGSFENSLKSATHEMQGINAVVACNSKRLRVPLCMMVTFRGQRLWVSARVPLLPENSLIYGSEDRGNTVVAEDAAFSAMSSIAKALNLKGHYVGSGPRSLTLLFGPVDVEVRKATDARMYVLDTARMFPPDPILSERRGFHLTYQLRQELVQSNEVPLSSDAFSSFGAHNRQQHDEEVRRASKRLQSTVIPKLAKTIALKFLPQIEVTMRYVRTLPLAEELHKNGVNVRYLGALLDAFVAACESSAAGLEHYRVCMCSHLLAEMCARGLKTIFLNNMRSTMTVNQPRDIAAASCSAACDLWNMCFSGVIESERFWRMELVPLILQKFFFASSSAMINKWKQVLSNVWSRDRLPQSDLNPGFYTLMFLRVSAMCGLEWDVDAQRDTSIAHRFAKGRQIFNLPLLKNIVPVVKFCEVPPYANVMKLIQDGKLEDAEYIYLGELQNREVILGDDPALVPLLTSLTTLYAHPYWKGERRKELYQARKRIVKIFQDKVNTCMTGAASPTVNVVRKVNYIEAYVDALCTLGEMHLEDRSLQDANTIFRTAYDVAQEELNPPSATLARAHHSFGRILWTLGRFPDALKRFEAALVACGVSTTSGIYGGATFSSLDISNSDFALTATAGDFLNSTNFEIRQRMYLDIKLSRALLHHELGSNQRAEEDAMEVYDTMVEGLGVSEHILTSPEYARCLLVVGTVCTRSAPLEALRRLEEACGLFISLFGERSRMHALCLAKIARAQLQLAQFDDGLRSCEEALSMFQNLQDRSLDVAETLWLLSKFFFFFYHEQPINLVEGAPRRLATCRAYLTQAKEIYVSLFGSQNHPRVARIKCVLADWHRVNRQPREMWDEAREAVNIFEEQKFYYTHVGIALRVLGRAQCMMGNHVEALQLFYRALSILETSRRSDFLVLELIGHCFSHNRIRQAAPVLDPDSNKERLGVESALIVFYVHHAAMFDSMTSARQAVVIYRSLFPFSSRPQDWNPECVPYFQALARVKQEIEVRCARVSGGDEVMLELGKLTDTEDRRSREYDRYMAQRRDETNRLASEEAERHKFRKLECVLKQLKMYVHTARTTNALHMFVPVLEAYMECYPLGADPIAIEAYTAERQKAAEEENTRKPVPVVGKLEDVSDTSSDTSDTAATNKKKTAKKEPPRPEEVHYEILQLLAALEDKVTAKEQQLHSDTSGYVTTTFRDMRTRRSGLQRRNSTLMRLQAHTHRLLRHGTLQNLKLAATATAATIDTSASAYRLDPPPPPLLPSASMSSLSSAGGGGGGGGGAEGGGIGAVSSISSAMAPFVFGRQNSVIYQKSSSSSGHTSTVFTDSVERTTTMTTEESVSSERRLSRYRMTARPQQKEHQRRHTKTKGETTTADKAPTTTTTTGQHENAKRRKSKGRRKGDNK